MRRVESYLEAMALASMVEEIMSGKKNIKKINKFLELATKL